MKKLYFYLLIFAVLSWFSVNSFAAEHPGTATTEHPGTAETEHPSGETSEHPPHGVAPGEPVAEHPGEGPMFSADEIIKGIKDHIRNVTEANNGIFPLEDPQEGKSLNLKLEKVHEDKVSHIKKEDACFACTDFITDDGKTRYDVDFWMKKDASGNLVVYDTKIHKKDGEPRFTYKDDEIVPVK